MKENKIKKRKEINKIKVKRMIERSRQIKKSTKRNIRQSIERKQV